MRISFLGAADTVTGSRHLVEAGGTRVLLDCGMFQGFKVFRERNWQAPPPELLEVDAVVLSHAHLDHSGWLPRLVQAGYCGPVYASPATRDLASVLLLDAAHLQEEDARRANRYGYSRHPKALPLYTVADAQRALSLIRPLAPGLALPVGELQVTLSPVGHLLGACAVSVTRGRQTLVFSGDLGRSGDLLMPPPQTVAHADLLLVESTYGNRVHPPEDVEAELAQIVATTAARGGSVLLPSFAVGRAQALLLVLQRLRRAGRIPREMPIYLDSPMAIEATAVYRRHRKLLRVKPAEVQRLTDAVHLVVTGAESMQIARQRMPSIIISASGMATGGRVLHHLKRMAPDPRHHVVFAGFQVAGSRGARLVAGETEVRIHGEDVPVRAGVTHLEGFSAHADADELMRWMAAIRRAPRETFVVHGEPAASDALRLRIQHELGWPVRVAPAGATVDA
jgi:metallo-beta-lactamase family protein